MYNQKIWSECFPIHVSTSYSIAKSLNSSFYKHGNLTWRKISSGISCWMMVTTNHEKAHVISRVLKFSENFLPFKQKLYLSLIHTKRFLNEFAKNILTFLFHFYSSCSSSKCQNTKLMKITNFVGRLLQESTQHHHHRLHTIGHSDIIINCRNFVIVFKITHCEGMQLNGNNC